jgi:hypothetical protein
MRAAAVVDPMTSFEAHITVLCPTPDLPRFAATCQALGLKALHIELPEGEVTSQPMTTSAHRGPLVEVRAHVEGLARQLVTRGFEVTRVKLEALTLDGLPGTDGYFEYHLKVVTTAAALDALRDAVRPHGGHLSKNALRRRSDGAEERFVTLRVPGAGVAAADARFAALEGAVRALPVRIARRVREYVVVDSRPSLDGGWGAS